MMIFLFWLRVERRELKDESRKLRGGLKELGRLLICAFQKHVAKVNCFLYLCGLQ